MRHRSRRVCGAAEQALHAPGCSIYPPNIRSPSVDEGEAGRGSRRTDVIFEFSSRARLDGEILQGSLDQKSPSTELSPCRTRARLIRPDFMIQRVSADGKRENLDVDGARKPR
jgi:hypothetical protein